VPSIFNITVQPTLQRMAPNDLNDLSALRGWMVILKNFKTSKSLTEWPATKEVQLSVILWTGGNIVRGYFCLYLILSIFLSCCLYMRPEGIFIMLLIIISDT
jgi:hypothetical protein